MIQFTDIAGPIRDMLQSENIPQLLNRTRAAILRVFKADRVDFLLMDREFIANYKASHGKTIKLLHAHFRFEIAVPDDNKNSYEF